MVVGKADEIKNGRLEHVGRPFHDGQQQFPVIFQNTHYIAVIKETDVAVFDRDDRKDVAFLEKEIRLADQFGTGDHRHDVAFFRILLVSELDNPLVKEPDAGRSGSLLQDRFSFFKMQLGGFPADLFPLAFIQRQHSHPVDETVAAVKQGVVVYNRINKF